MSTRCRAMRRASCSAAVSGSRGPKLETCQFATPHDADRHVEAVLSVPLRPRSCLPVTDIRLHSGPGGHGCDRRDGRACWRGPLVQTAPPTGRAMGPRVLGGRLGAFAGSRLHGRRLCLAKCDQADRAAATPDRPAHRRGPRLVPRRPWRAAGHSRRVDDSHVAVPARRRTLLAALRPVERRVTGNAPSPLRWRPHRRSADTASPDR